MAKKLRRVGQLSAKATEMRNLALKASEATDGFGKISPFELAISWTNAENVAAPWGQGIKSSVTFFNDHAADFPMATGDLNSFIRDATSKVKDQLDLDVIPEIRIGYGIEDGLMGGIEGGRVFGQYNHKFENQSSFIDIFPDVIWNRVKEDGGNIDDFLNYVTETVSHEMRHMYQYEGNSKKNWSEKNIKYREKHKMNPGDKYPNYKTYYNDPIEKDARKFEKKFKRRNIKDLKNNLQNRQSKLAEITQRKLKEQQHLHPFKRGEGTWRIADDNFDYGPAEFDLSGLDISNNPVDIQDSENYRKLKKGEGTYRFKSKESQTAESQTVGHRTIDMSDEDWANVTDDEIYDWAQNGEEYEYATAQREAAKERLKVQQQSTQPNTDTNTDVDVDTDVEPKFATEENLNPKNDPIKNKNVAGGVDDSIKAFVDPSGFTDLDQFADLTDDEIQTYLKTLNNVDRQAAYDDILQKRQLAKAQRVLSDPEKFLDEFFSIQPLESSTGKYHPEKGWIPPFEDHKNPKGYSRPELDIDVDDSGNAILNKTGGTINVGEAKPKIRPRAPEGDDIFGWLKKHKLGLGDAINVLFSIGSYNEARREGHGVVSSAARAAGQFVMGELTGFWGGLAFQAAKAVPKMAIKGTELLYKENRKMNSAANSQVFGGVQFQDTQQLATMRQSGMEMAKMAQYNLQQTLMGNEASYLHR